MSLTAASFMISDSCADNRAYKSRVTKSFYISFTNDQNMSESNAVFNKPCILSSRETLEIISKFLTSEWKQLSENDVRVERLQFGMNSAVYVAERKVPPSTTVPALLEPTKLLIRHLSEVDPSDYPEFPAGIKEADLLVALEAAKLGIGPKIYGIFAEGRVEEYIDSRHLTTKDFNEDAEIRRQVAKSLAKLHSINLPLPRPEHEAIHIIRALLVGWYQVREEYARSNGVLRNGLNVDRIVKYDFAKDVEWLNMLLTGVPQRIVLRHSDTQFSNILIRKQSSDSMKTGQSSVVIIDFDTANYNNRGKDFGLLFAQQVCDFQTEIKHLEQFPSREQCMSFLREYQTEVKKLGFIHDFDPSGQDSLEHLYLEALIGAVESVLGFLLGFLKYYIEFELDNAENNVMNRNTCRMFDWYLLVKDTFQQRFPDLI